jgi:hypothetical protein
LFSKFVPAVPATYLHLLASMASGWEDRRDALTSHGGNF